MKKWCDEHGVFTETDGVVRLPFLVNGEFILPPVWGRSEIEMAFSSEPPETRYLKYPGGQIIRLPILSKSTNQPETQFLYLLLPEITPAILAEISTGQLTEELISLKTTDVADYIRETFKNLQANLAVLEQVKLLYRKISPLPDIFLEGIFASIWMGTDASIVTTTIDRELSAWHTPGSRFLDGWVELQTETQSGIAAGIAHTLPNPIAPAGGSPKYKPHLRAMPTRQLHITAGNAPEIPLASALRMWMSKSCGVIKTPLEAALTGALLALAVPKNHPLTRQLSVLYWQGGDPAIENRLFMPGSFDRVVVWGSPETVASVQSRAMFARVISLNPRYGASLVGREGLDDPSGQAPFLAAQDSLTYNQQACSSSLIHYVEGSEAQVMAYARNLAKILGSWDTVSPVKTQAHIQGQIKRMKRGKYALADWIENTENPQITPGGEFSSGVMVLHGEMNMLDHPMNRLIAVRRVERLEDVLSYLHAGVSTVGVFPEARRLALRDAIAARGVSAVLPLGQAESAFFGAPQDGMMVLNQLVDWKVG